MASYASPMETVSTVAYMLDTVYVRPAAVVRSWLCARAAPKATPVAFGVRTAVDANVRRTELGP